MMLFNLHVSSGPGSRCPGVSVSRGKQKQLIRQTVLFEQLRQARIALCTQWTCKFDKREIMCCHMPLHVAMLCHASCLCHAHGCTLLLGMHTMHIMHAQYPCLSHRHRCRHPYHTMHAHSYYACTVFILCVHIMHTYI